MNTFTTPLPSNRQFQSAVGEKLIPATLASIREILAMLAAVSVATVIVMLSVWVAGMEVTAILSASAWGVGLIFLGLAIDNREPKAILQLLTGISLLVLAWLQNTVSPDYTIVSGVIVATWAAVATFKQLR